MYAIIATGGKQYKVAEGDIIKVEKLGAEDGSKVTFDNVIVIGKDDDLLCGDAVVYKYKRKTGYHKKNGHRQPYTEVKIEAINA